MPLQDLVYTSWMAECEVLLAMGEIHSGSGTFFAVTGVIFCVPYRRPLKFWTAFI
jgi:hypothetical protein